MGGGARPGITHGSDDSIIFTGIPVPTQVPYEYKIFHTKLVNRGLEVVIREELTDNDQWKRYEIFQDTKWVADLTCSKVVCRPVAPMALAHRASTIRFRQKP